MQERLPDVNVEFSLARLLQPLSVETFLDEIWGATHYHVKRSCAGYFDDLLHGPSAVEELLELFRPDPSAVRLVQRYEIRGSDTYRRAMAAVIARRRGFDGGLFVIMSMGVTVVMLMLAMLIMVMVAAMIVVVRVR